MRGYKNFESDPHPGELRHKIEIGYTENAINENGYPAPTDVVVCRVWAAVTDAGNQHYRAADVMNTEAVINFTIRYREDIKPGMWVRFQGDKWNISTLGEYSFKRTYHSDRSGTLTLPEYVYATYNELMKNGWRMKEIDEMDMLGFLRLRAWDAQREHEKKKPRQRFIDEVWPGVKP